MDEESNAPGPSTSQTKTATTQVESVVESFDMESSLEGFAALPPHIRWTATTSLPAEDVEEVSFIVDGRRIWTDVDPPYSYGEEGAYLATRVFAYDDRGRHRFTVRVEGKNGERWSETVEARVPKSKIESRPPLNYVIWDRLSAADAESPTLPEGYPLFSGTAHIYLGGDSLYITRNYKRAFAYEIISMDRKKLRLGVPIFLGSHENGGAVSGYHLGGVQCAVDGPPATYALSALQGPFVGRVGGMDHYANYVRVQAVNESCEKRRRLLEGTWALTD
jgi:hypothetical protein